MILRKPATLAGPAGRFSNLRPARVRLCPTGACRRLGPAPFGWRACVLCSRRQVALSRSVAFRKRIVVGGPWYILDFTRLDHPEYLYNPRENTTEQSWTHSPVPGNTLADKPVYLLTSARTYSGAEQFSYDLKMLKRATLVGETTGGGAHSGVWHRIDDHFGMGIPETKAINPFSKTDWAEIGVEPDVKVNAADALVTAEKLAQGKLQKK